MKLFLDTNVVIDVIAAREPFVADSRAIFNLCENGKAEGSISALTLCTVSYVLRKFVTPGTMRTKLRAFRNVLTPVDLTVADRIKEKHLFTLQQGVSSNQLAEMYQHGIVLVVPQPIITSFPDEYRTKIMHLTGFVDFIKTSQNVG